VAHSLFVSIRLNAVYLIFASAAESYSKRIINIVYIFILNLFINNPLWCSG
jgi:hypothetical protein